MKQKGADLKKATHMELVEELQSRWNSVAFIFYGNKKDPLKVQTWRHGPTVEVIGLLDVFSQRVRESLVSEFRAAETPITTPVTKGIDHAE
jgi:hypothetical protein